MGLKIKYRFTFEGTREEVLDRMKSLRAELKELGVPTTPLWKVTGKDRNENAYKLMYPENPMIAELFFDGLTNNGKGIKEGMGFIVGTPEGCGVFTVALACKKKSPTSWASCYCETKTQYAKDFLKDHAFVCALVDLTSEYFTLDHVDDYGEYYTTRDKDLLMKKLEEWDFMVQNIGEMLKEKSDDGKVVTGLDGWVEDYVVEKKEET